MTQTNPKPVFGDQNDFFEEVKSRKPALFLDYDGTLTPIVSRPEDAQISGEMKELLSQLAEKYTVAVITGRDMDDVKKLVGLTIWFMPEVTDSEFPDPTDFTKSMKNLPFYFLN
nr:trehalose-phosphatase [Marinilabilia salmonicolor]